MAVERRLGRACFCTAASAAATLAGAASEAAAQTRLPELATEGAARDTGRPPRTDEVDEVVVTGRRLPDESGGQVAERAQLGVLGERDISDTPFNIQSYTSELIGNRQARTVADILDSDPSARATWSPAAGYTYEEYAIRGILVNSSDVTLNGLYGLSPTGAMPAEGIERLEVLKGPSAMLGGVALHGSLGGAINVVPKRARAAPLRTVSASHDADGFAGAHADFGRRFGSASEFGVRLNGVYRSGDTAIDRQSLTLGFTSAGLDYVGGDIRLSIDGVYHRRDRDVPLWQLAVRPGFRIPAPPRPGSNFQQSWARLDAEDVLGMVRAEYDFAPGWTGFAAAGHKATTIDALVALGSLLNDRGDIAQTFAYIPRSFDTTTGEVGVRGGFATGPLRHSLSVVVSALRQDQGAFNSTVRGSPSNIYEPMLVPLPEPVDTRGQVRRNSSAIRTSLSVADTVSLSDERVLLLVGGRLQRVQSPTYDRAGARTSAYDETVFTPAVGVVLKPLHGLSLYGNYVEGLTQPFAPSGALNSAEVFPPARTEQREVGAKLDLSQIQIGLSFFDIAQPRTILDPVTFRYDVDGEQRTRGIDLNLAGEPLRGLRLLGGFTLLDATQARTAGGVNQGNKAIGVPDIQANIGAEIDVPWVDGLTLTGLVLHTGRQYVDAFNLQRIPAWTRVDIGVRQSFALAGQRVTLRAQAENLFNEAYWASAARDLTLGAPRTWKFSMTVDF